MFPVEFAVKLTVRKLESWGYSDGQTDGRTDDSI